MDYNKQFVALQCCTKNFDINVAMELLNNKDFIKDKSSQIIYLIGDELTEDNLKNKPDYFNFWEEQLLKMAQTEGFECVIYDFMDLINSSTCMSTSSVLVAVTILECVKCADRVCLEFFLNAVFNNLIEKNDEDLKKVLPIVIKHLLKINKQFRQYQSVLYYFSRIAFLVLRANTDSVEFVDIFSSVIYDPFCLLEQEIDEIEEKTYLASFYYLYFKTGKIWGPKIYNQFYILEKCLNLALSVFKNDIFGKHFAKLILSKFKDNAIPLHLLNKCHQEFVIEAAGSSVYNDEFNIRKDSIESLILYLNKLCNEAQYVVFKYAFRTLEINIKAQLIITMKNLLCSKIISNKDLGYFQGVRLLELIRLCCDIPKGSKCDVVDNKEYILAVITVIYVLYAYNDTVLNMGQAYVDDINQFIKTVQNAIYYTKEQCLIESRKLCDKNSIETDFPDGTQLTKSEKINMLSQFNTAISVMQINLNLLKEKLSNNNRNKN